jgi:hypothetical protein
MTTRAPFSLRPVTPTLRKFRTYQFIAGFAGMETTGVFSALSQLRALARITSATCHDRHPLAPHVAHLT